MKIAYLFPGQGSQAVGMGQDLCSAYKEARDIFDLADSLFGAKLSSLCFYGPEEELKQTINTQPALFTTSVAALKALQAAGAPGPQATAGHSIGEYAALVAAGALDFETGLHLVVRRAQEMNRAAAERPGTMAAVLGMEPDAVNDVCATIRSNGCGIVQAANFNAAGQIVISGEVSAVEAASVLAKERGAKRVLPLTVSGAFHSELMSGAAAAMGAVLKDAKIHDPNIPLVGNLSADYVTSAEVVRAGLEKQIDHSVRWQESMELLIADGFDTFIEVGHGNVLSGIVKRMPGEKQVFTAGNPEGIAACAALAGN